MLARRLAALLVVAAPLAAPATSFADVDLIVRRDPGLSAAERADLRADAGVDFERRLRLPDTEVVSVPASDAADALRELRADPDVVWAQRDAGVSAQATTGGDPYFGLLWGLHNTGQTISGAAGVADADMDVPEAWSLATGAGVTVAVVDTGADAAHEDLSGSLAVNGGETGAGRESNGVDDDGDGLVDDWRGYDFVYGDNDPNDVQGHGSHVTGTIAAQNANGKGITGLAPDAKVLMLKALGDTGQGSWSDLANAFDFAGDRGIRVVNASLGGSGTVPVIDDVIAMHPNTLFVVSAGNDNLNLDLNTVYPCEAIEPNVLCVGASDNRDQRASFSNYSSTAVDVFAPGVSVLSTTGGSYWYYNGTSMAAPHVTAEAALLLSREPGLTAAQLKAAIVDSADAKAALAAYGLNGGRANARAALDLISPAPDGDGDGVADELDNCVAVANPSQADSDGDGAGDVCDDGDGDNVLDVYDNCPASGNPLQSDTDADGVGDACDPTPHGGDSDFDGVPDADDRCPLVPGISGGCPAAPVAPVATGPSLTAPKASTARCGRRACMRSLRVTASTSSATGARIALSAQSCRRGRCSWRTVLSRALTLDGGAVDTTLRVKLPAGRARVTVTALGTGAAASRTANVTLR